MITNFLNKVQQSGLEITTVYDIGAYHGNWSKNIKSTAIPNAQFILFEANPVYAHMLAKTGFTYFCGTVLSNNGRSSVEFYNGTNTGDSYYKETSKIYDNQSSITLPCMSLDAIKQYANLPTPQLIKLDTQGSELDILSGAESFLHDVDLIYTECPIMRYNHGAPDIQDYLDFFKQRQYIPIDIFEIHRGEETLIQIDIMFMKKDTKDRILGSNISLRPLI